MAERPRHRCPIPGCAASYDSEPSLLAHVDKVHLQRGPGANTCDGDSSAAAMAAQQQQDHYQVLGVGRNASSEEIKKRFHQMTLLFHPDKQQQQQRAAGADSTQTASSASASPSQANAGISFQDIKKAYDILKSEHSRKAYNEAGSGGGGGGGGGGDSGGGFGGVLPDGFRWSAELLEKIAEMQAHHPLHSAAIAAEGPKCWPVIFEALGKVYDQGIAAMTSQRTAPHTVSKCPIRSCTFSSESESIVVNHIEQRHPRAAYELLLQNSSGDQDSVQDMLLLFPGTVAGVADPIIIPSSDLEEATTSLPAGPALLLSLVLCQVPSYPTVTASKVIAAATSAPIMGEPNPAVMSVVEPLLQILLQTLQNPVAALAQAQSHGPPPVVSSVHFLSETDATALRAALSVDPAVCVPRVGPFFSNSRPATASAAPIPLLPLARLAPGLRDRILKALNAVAAGTTTVTPESSTSIEKFLPVVTTDDFARVPSFRDGRQGCSMCSKELGFFSSVYHCESCGQALCNACCNTRRLALFGHDGLQVVCANCMIAANSQEAEYFLQRALGMNIPASADGRSESNQVALVAFAACVFRPDLAASADRILTDLGTKVLRGPGSSRSDVVSLLVLLYLWRGVAGIADFVTTHVRGKTLDERKLVQIVLMANSAGLLKETAILSLARDIVATLPTPSIATTVLGLYATVAGRGELRLAGNAKAAWRGEMLHWLALASGTHPPHATVGRAADTLSNLHRQLACACAIYTAQLSNSAVAAAGTTVTKPSKTSNTTATATSQPLTSGPGPASLVTAAAAQLNRMFEATLPSTITPAQLADMLKTFAQFGPLGAGWISKLIAAPDAHVFATVAPVVLAVTKQQSSIFQLEFVEQILLQSPHSLLTSAAQLLDIACQDARAVYESTASPPTLMQRVLLCLGHVRQELSRLPSVVGGKASSAYSPEAVQLLLQHHIADLLNAGDAASAMCVSHVAHQLKLKDGNDPVAFWFALFRSSGSSSSSVSTAAESHVAPATLSLSSKVQVAVILMAFSSQPPSRSSMEQKSEIQPTSLLRSICLHILDTNPSEPLIAWVLEACALVLSDPTLATSKSIRARWHALVFRALETTAQHAHHHHGAPSGLHTSPPAQPTATATATATATRLPVRNQLLLQVLDSAAECLAPEPLPSRLLAKQVELTASMQAEVREAVETKLSHLRALFNQDHCEALAHELVKAYNAADVEVLKAFSTFLVTVVTALDSHNQTSKQRTHNFATFLTRGLIHLLQGTEADSDLLQAALANPPLGCNVLPKILSSCGLRSTLATKLLNGFRGFKATHRASLADMQRIVPAVQAALGVSTSTPLPTFHAFARLLNPVPDIRQVIQCECGIWQEMQGETEEKVIERAMAYCDVFFAVGPIFSKIGCLIIATVLLAKATSMATSNANKYAYSRLCFELLDLCVSLADKAPPPMRLYAARWFLATLLDVAVASKGACFFASNAADSEHQRSAAAFKLAHQLGSLVSLSQWCPLVSVPPVLAADLLFVMLVQNELLARVLKEDMHAPPGDPLARPDVIQFAVLDGYWRGWLQPTERAPAMLFSADLSEEDLRFCQEVSCDDRFALAELRLATASSLFQHGENLQAVMYYCAALVLMTPELHPELLPPAPLDVEERDYQQDQVGREAVDEAASTTGHTTGHTTGQPRAESTAAAGSGSGSARSRQPVAADIARATMFALRVYANIAAAHFKAEQFDKVIETVDGCLSESFCKVAADNFLLLMKCRLRKARALVALGEFDAAAVEFNAATQLGNTFVPTSPASIKEKSSALLAEVKTFLRAATEQHDKVKSGRAISVHFPGSFEEARAASIAALLAEQQMPVEEVQSLLMWSVLKRDKDGWLAAPHEYRLQGMTLHAVHGFTLNVATGAMKLHVQEASSRLPALFNDGDIGEVFQKALDGAIFTLEQPTESKSFSINEANNSHPFQTMKFSPASLGQGGNFLPTLLHTDYLLKMMTTGVEISAKAPFPIRPSSIGLTSRLPTSLRQAVRPVSSSVKLGSNSDAAHRFWIKSGILPFRMEQHGDTIDVTFGELPMAVHKQLLRKNARGELEDDEVDSDDSSDEARFAREFTANYNALGQYFPELLRLRELQKLCAIRQLVAQVLMSPLSETRQEVVDFVAPQIQQQFDSLPNVFPLEHDASKVSSHVEELMETNRREIVAQHGWTAWNQFESKARSQIRSSVISQLQTASTKLLSDLTASLSTISGHYSYTLQPTVDNALRDRRYVRQLAESVAEGVWQKKQANARERIQNVKQQTGLDATQKFELGHFSTGSLRTYWVPAAFSQHTHSRVYGGVSLLTQMQAARNILNPPRTSSYTMSPATLTAQRAFAVVGSAAQVMDNNARFLQQQAALRNSNLMQSQNHALQQWFQRAHNYSEQGQSHARGRQQHWQGRAEVYVNATATQQREMQRNSSFQFNQRNLERMQRGRAAQYEDHQGRLRSMELNHIVPNRDGGPNTSANYAEVTRVMHARSDPCRRLSAQESRGANAQYNARYNTQANIPQYYNASGGGYR